MFTKHKTLLVIALICSIGLSAAVVDSEKFPFGVYSLMHNGHKVFGSQRVDIAAKMKLLGYNLTVMETNNSDKDLDGLLAVLQANGVGAVLSDKSWSNDPTDSRHFAMLPLSTSNFQRFEAEFSDETPVKPEDINQSLYWYGSAIGSNNQQVPRRSGAFAKDATASYQHAWQCVQNKDKAGFAFTDINYRWKNRKGEAVKFSEEFRFHNTHQLSTKDTDSLYIKYRIKLDKVKAGLGDDAVLFSFRPSGYLGRETDFSTEAKIKHRLGKQQGLQTNFTYGDYKALGMPKGYFELELSIGYNDLRESGIMSDDFDHNPATEGSWWWYYLRGFSPRLYWNDNNDLSLDFVEIEDQIHRNLRVQADFYRKGINKRLRDFLALPHGSIIKYFYPLDEPFQTHLNSFVELSAVMDDDLPPMFTASYDVEHQNFLMGDGKNYFDQVALVRDMAKPRFIAPDMYPLKPGISFSKGQPSFIQTVLDDKLLKVYQECKDYALQEEQRRFYPIVQTFGRWNGKQWSSWLLPPKATQKALLYLPFCYGPDGQFSYLLAGILNAKGEGDYAQFLVKDNGPIDTNTHTWEAVSELNPRLKYYGELIQDWSWLSANTINTDTYNPAAELKAMKLSSMRVQPTGRGEYEGYLQCGYYLDDKANPAIFAVNRRTDYILASAPQQVSTAIPPQDYAKSYAAYEAQTLEINVQSGAFGSFAAVYDPLDSYLVIGDKDMIKVSLAAGEGRMLKLVSSLPTNLKKGNYSLKTAAVIKDKVTLNKKASVVCEGDLTLLPGSTLVLKKGSTLSIRGKLIQMPGAKIESEGRLLISATSR